MMSSLGVRTSSNHRSFKCQLWVGFSGDYWELFWEPWESFLVLSRWCVHLILFQITSMNGILSCETWWKSTERLTQIRYDQPACNKVSHISHMSAWMKDKIRFLHPRTHALRFIEYRGPGSSKLSYWGCPSTSAAPTHSTSTCAPLCWGCGALCAVPIWQDAVHRPAWFCLSFYSISMFAALRLQYLLSLILVSLVV